MTKIRNVEKYSEQWNGIIMETILLEYLNIRILNLFRISIFDIRICSN